MRLLTLASCLAVAVTLAWSANLLIDAALTPPPAPRPRAAIRLAVAPRPLDPARLARAFGTPLRPREPAPPPPRPLPLKLLGTLDSHAAALLDAASGQCRTLRVGDRWNDVEVVGVGHGHVTVRRDGLEEELGVGRALSVAAVRAGLPIALTATGATLAMRRADLEQQLPDLARRAMEGGRVVPAFQGSTMVGFKLFAVRPGSLYEELGLQNGDVLESVNGAPLSNPQVAFTLLGRLRDSPSVAVSVDRGGQKLTWQLRLD